MTKRLRWFISGTGFGIGATIWVRRKIRDKVAEVTPLALTKATADSVVRFKDLFVKAVGDARIEAVQTEAMLREEMGLESKRGRGGPECAKSR